MEDLFSTNITVNDKSMRYRVIFDNEKYVFLPEGDNKTVSPFSFKREHDEWISQDSLSQDVKEQALEALDKYLLKQH